MKKSGRDRSASGVWGPVVLLFCWVLALFCTAQTEAQHLKSKVVLNLTQLAEVKQKRVEGLQETIRDYIDNSRWIDDPFDFEVPLSFTMSLQDISQTYEDRYLAQLQVSNNRDIQYRDKYCRFPYQMNDPLFRDDSNYDPLTGLIDFYVYMILGGEMDKRAILGGTPFYEKALEVCQNAGFGRSEFYQGWDLRKELVEKVLDDEMATFRKLEAVFFRAKVYHKDGRGKKARQYCRAVILKLGKMFEANPQDERIKDFFKYHYFEIGELFEDEKASALFEKLIELDPEHREEYEKYID
ncbi:MAG: DUF4835 family protein [bacterium]